MQSIDPMIKARRTASSELRNKTRRVSDSIRALRRRDDGNTMIGAFGAITLLIGSALWIYGRHNKQIAPERVGKICCGLGLIPSSIFFLGLYDISKRVKTLHETSAQLLSEWRTHLENQ